MRNLCATLVAAITMFAAAGCDCGDDDTSDDDTSDDDTTDDDDTGDDDTGDDDTGDDDSTDDDTLDDDTGDDDTTDDDTSDDDTVDDDDTSDDDTGDVNAPTCVVDVPSGNYPGPYAPGDVDPLSVTITCADDLDPTPTVYYTVDGTAPQIGGGTTFSVASPAVVAIANTTTLRWFAADAADNESAPETRQYGIYMWEDFESYHSGDEVDAPWYVAGDPWDGTIPTAQTRDDPPGGMYLEMVDDNDSPDGAQDTYALVTREDPLHWPNEVVLRFEWGLSDGTGARFFSYSAVGAVVYWQIIIDLSDGDVLAWDHVPGDWIDCGDVAEDDWYEFEIAFNHSADTYSVSIDGDATPCADLQVLSVVSGLDEGVSVATFGNPGVTGTFMFDNLQISPP